MHIIWQQSFRRLIVRANLIVVFLMIGSLSRPAQAQESQAPAQSSNDSSANLSEQVTQLRTLVEQLQKQVSDLQGRVPTTQLTESVGNGPSAQGPAQPEPAQQTVQNTGAASQNSATSEAHNRFDFLHGTTLNVLLDGYYEYNFNAPIGRVNLLRAYDVLSNAFSLNQADVVLENAPDVASGKRWGGRIDLQFGQATETLQGNAANEPRPEIYRNIFQAYGTYVVPIGSGLNVDVGKWASSLGIEGNFTQDQMNYSRSFWFNFLPFYHMGARVHYQVNNKIGVNYWITNGTQQTELFNSYNDQLVVLFFSLRRPLTGPLTTTAARNIRIFSL